MIFKSFWRALKNGFIEGYKSKKSSIRDTKEDTFAVVVGLTMIALFVLDAASILRWIVFGWEVLMMFEKINLVIGTITFIIYLWGWYLMKKGAD